MTTSHTDDPAVPASRESRIAERRRQGGQLVVDEAGLVRDEPARKIVRFVAQYWREHRHGPTWMDVAVHMGWDRPQVEGAIRALCRHRILQAGRKPRSLSVHPQLRGRRKPNANA